MEILIFLRMMACPLLASNDVNAKFDLDNKIANIELNKMILFLWNPLNTLPTKIYTF